MTVKELKQRLEDRPENTAVMVLNTESCCIENAKMPDHFGEGDAQIVLFLPEDWNT